MSSENEQVPKPGGRFDPNEHLMKLKGKDYLEVKWRLVWFREEHPTGSITATPINIGDKSALFQATVTDSNGAVAIAHGSETEKDFKDFIEKAETKAIGRALAWLGYGTQFAPELTEGERLADAPVQFNGRSRNPDPTPWQQQAPQGNRGSTPAIASDKQLNFIRGLWKQLGYVAIGEDGKEHHDTASLDMYCESNWGVALAQMSKEQAGQVLDALQAIQAERQAPGDQSYDPNYQTADGQVAPF